MRLLIWPLRGARFDGKFQCSILQVFKARATLHGSEENLNGIKDQIDDKKVMHYPVGKSLLH